jgi:hypothetical protein
VTTEGTQQIPKGDFIKHSHHLTSPPSERPFPTVSTTASVHSRWLLGVDLAHWHELSRSATRSRTVAALNSRHRRTMIGLTLVDEVIQ